LIKNLIVAVLLFNVLFLSAQTAISGYLDTTNTELNQEIYLSQIAIGDIGSYEQVKKIAISKIDENGFFHFKKELISDKNAIYQLHINRIDQNIKDNFHDDQLFILSKTDSIHFRKSIVPFSQYVNTNVADREWQKLRSFEERLRPFGTKNRDSLSAAYLGNLKTYTKDSLEILMVKLIGIKQLDQKELLEKDIIKNPEYYVALLNELILSDIERSEYLFLENKLAFITTEVAENKYTSSKIIIVLLGLVVVGLIFMIYRLKYRKNQDLIADLSKQEKNIQGLIIAGLSNKEIANELFISLSTVKTHITNIYSKLQVSNRQELLRKTQNI
jgi:DNA-binding CsgD family transcriptional regulator